MFFKKDKPAKYQSPLVALIDQNLQETRRNHIINYIFKFSAFGYLLLLLTLSSNFKISELFAGNKDHTAVIKLHGVIAEDKLANAKDLIKSLETAFEDQATKGVIIDANSPGGSPVQSDEVYQAIRRLRAEHKDIPIYAVVSELCASGCYYIVSATDKIFVSKATIIGSIGVIMNGFGAVDLIKNIGVERRVITAGNHKALLDPFMPANPEENAHLKTMIAEIHQQFIMAVKEGRGNRLGKTAKLPDIELFSGLVWTGVRGIELGLADDYGNIKSVAKDIIKAKDLVAYDKNENPLDLIGSSIGAHIEQSVSNFLVKQSTLQLQ